MVREQVEAIYRTEARGVFAVLVRQLRDFDLAEDALHEAFRAAMERWPQDGVPSNPTAWLIRAGRFKGIDALRKRSRLRSAEGHDPPADADPSVAEIEETIPDETVRLIFTCCHPSIAQDSQVALTLREVCGLTTEEIAAAFLTPTPTIAQRIVRAKNKIRAANIPFEAPNVEELPTRLEAVRAVIYLLFNEGYSASRGEHAMRPDLSGEAIRLGRLVARQMPAGESLGLLALMLLHDSRRAARVTPDGDLILLEDQDRGLWDQALAEEGRVLVQRALSGGTVGQYTLQAAISAVHSEAPTFAETDWEQVAGIYDALRTRMPSAVVELNRAVAIAMWQGPQVGLNLIEPMLEAGELHDYPLARAAQADLYRRLGNLPEAKIRYEQAILLCQQEPEQRFFRRRIREMGF